MAEQHDKYFATDIVDLAHIVVDRYGPPVDYLQLAATLEVMGYTDSYTSKHFNLPNIFALAKYTFPICHDINHTVKLNGERRGGRPRLSLLVTSYLRGMIFLLPITLSLILVVFGVGSIWGPTEIYATAINSLALSLVISMIITGGIGRSMAARIHEAIALKRPVALVRPSIVYTLIALGAITIVASLLDLLIGEVSFYITLLCSNGLGLLWMGLFILYSIRKEWLFAVCFLVSAAAAFILYEIFDLDYLAVQLIGTTVLASLVASSGFIALARYSRRKQEDESLSGMSVPWWMSIYSGQLIFGFLYFSLIFADRLANWTAGGEFSFHSSYEASLVIAMFSLLLVSGTLEYQVSQFWTSIRYSRRETDLPSRKRILKFYHRSGVKYAFSALIGLGISLLLALSIDAGQQIGVVLVASTAYILIAWGSFACGIALGFKRKLSVAMAGLMALIVDVSLSLYLSRSFNPEMASYGLLAGGIVFFLVSTFLLLRLASNYAFYQYSSW